MGKSAKKDKNRKSRIYLIVLLTVLTVSGFIVIKNRRGNMLREEMYKAIKKGVNLLETKEILSASLFRGKAAYAYQLASEIPEVIDQQFCYCYCRKNHGHKTLLTCFTTDHGAKCDICIDEVIMANNLLKKGYNLAQITEKIDDVFSKAAKKAHSQHF